MENLTEIIKHLAVSTNTKVKLLQTAVFPAVLFGCKGKQIKERLMIPWGVRRVNASVTGRIVPKHSLETLATISKLKYFGHIMHSSDSMEKELMLGLTDGSGKLMKTVYKTISRNMRNCDDELVQHLNCHTKQSAMDGPDV